MGVLGLLGLRQLHMSAPNYREYLAILISGLKTQNYFLRITLKSVLVAIFFYFK